MGLQNSPDIFQEKMSELMVGLDFVRTYIDDLLVITRREEIDTAEMPWKRHIMQLQKVFELLRSAGKK